MNVPCDLCEGPDGYHRGGTTYTCNTCQAARRRLDRCDPGGIARPTQDELERAAELLARGAPLQPVTAQAAPDLRPERGRPDQPERLIMKRTIGTALLTGGLVLGFAISAHAGHYTYYQECAPNGDTTVYITAWDGPTTIYIDGIRTSMLTTGPGVHVIEYWGYPTDPDGNRTPGPDVLWNSYTVTIEPSDCPQPSTTAGPTTLPPAPTTSVEVTESTPALVPSATTAAPTPSLGIDVPPAASSNTLPATGQDNTPLVAAAGALLAIGSTLMLVRRPRKAVS